MAETSTATTTLRVRARVPVACVLTEVRPLDFGVLPDNGTAEAMASFRVSCTDPDRPVSIRVAEAPVLVSGSASAQGLLDCLLFGDEARRVPLTPATPVTCAADGMCRVYGRLTRRNKDVPLPAGQYTRSVQVVLSY